MKRKPQKAAMSSIITPDEFTLEEQGIVNGPFEYSELAQTEAEKLLREKPDIAQQLVQQYLKSSIKWEDFTPSERNLLLQVLIEKKAISDNESTAIKALIEADYVRAPPTPEEFLDNPEYLGPIGKTVYPYWKEHLLYALNPKNQIHEVAIKGSIGSGKCTHNSFIINDLGMLRIQELYAKREEIKYVLSESGMKKITNYHDEGETDTIKIETYNGFKLECRPNHRIRIFNGKEIIWKETKDLNVGDQAVVVRKQDIWGSNPNNLTIEEAELYGIITGDGCSTAVNLDITFGAREEDLSYINHVENNLIKRIPNVKYRLKKTVRKSGQQLYRINFYKEFRDYVQNLGFIGRAWEKKVPLCIRMGTKEVVAAFLRGYFDTDGTIYSNNNTLEVTTVSDVLSEEIQLLLLNFGIRTRRKFKANKCRGAWTVKIIGKESKEIFAREIGFNHPKKSALLKQHLSYEKTTWRHNDTEIIPVDPSVVEECRTNVRWKRIGLKQSRSMFVSTEGKQSFTYKALDKIVDKFGLEYLPAVLKKIYAERYIFTPITNLTPSRNHCYDLTVEDDPSYISSGFISHNTYFAILSQMYKLAVLSCLRNIPAYFGLSESTKICFGLFTLSLTKAETALSSEFKNMIGLSPYFRNVFPLKKTVQIRRVLNSLGDDSSFYEVMLPKNLMLLMGSKLQHALSLAVISGIIDEMNFRTKRTVAVDDDEDSAVSLYNQIRSRISSRFHKLGSVPGILCVISSAKTSSDFMESHIARIKNDPHAMIIGGSQWDVLPDKYSKEKFYVFVGSSKSSSRILEEGEVEQYPENSPNIIAVPTDLKHFFDYDLNSALREHAGIATSGMHLLFEDPLIIAKSWDTTRKNPFKEDEIELGLKTPKTIMDFIDWDEMFRDAGFAVIPRHHPSMLRVLHIDLSKSNDITGIAMGGVSSIIEKISKNPEGQYNVKQLAPEIWLDFAIGIKAPQGDMVDYEKLHQFIVFLRESRFKIRYITFDQYNCWEENTLINTNRGLIPIKEVRIGDIVSSKSGPNKVLNTFSYGKRPTIKITSSDKDTFEFTPNHRVEAAKKWKYVTRNKKQYKIPIWEWVYAKDLVIGDALNLSSSCVDAEQNPSFPFSKQECNPTTQAVKNCFSSWQPPEKMTVELAEFLGLLWGDGHIGKNHIALTVGTCEYEDAQNVFRALLGSCPTFNKLGDNYGELRVESRWFTKWLRENKLNKPIIPEMILKSNRLVQAAFLRGLFATDGSVDKNEGKVLLTTIHKDLAQQVRIILRSQFNIESCLVMSKAGYVNTLKNGQIIKKTKPSYIVSLRGKRESYLNQIGFSYGNKQAKLEKFKHIEGRSLYTRVEEISFSEAIVYDIEVENDPSYLANGLVSHNSVGPMQMLIKNNFEVGNLSVDRNDLAYIYLRDMIINKSISMYKNKYLEKELIHLTHAFVNGKAKVDHPVAFSDGSKGCFTGDTKIKLLDGRDLSFIDIEKEFGPDKPFYLYTMKEGKISVGKGYNARKTKTVTNLIEIHLDNKEIINCTPDHLFMLRDGTWCEAKDIKEGQSLMPLYTKVSVNEELKGYELYNEPSSGKWHFTHRMVGKWKYPDKGYTGNQNGNGLIHHEKGKLNNDPDSLIWCASSEEHMIHHRLDILERRKNPSFELNRQTKLKEYNDKAETKQRQSDRLKKMKANPLHTQKRKRASSAVGKITGKINLTKYNKSEKHRTTASEVGKITVYKAIAARTKAISIEQVIADRKAGLTNSLIAKKYGCSVSVIERKFMLAKRQGLDIPVAPYFTRNHKVTNIRLVACVDTPVYDITVEDTHNFALSSGVFVHNSKDMADATAGVVFNAMELLTNAGKFPDTSNTELSKGIIQNLFPAFKMDELPTGNAFSETEQIKQYIAFRSPFEK